jgi:hypothetical protein
MTEGKSANLHVQLETGAPLKQCRGDRGLLFHVLLAFMCKLTNEDYVRSDWACLKQRLDAARYKRTSTCHQHPAVSETKETVASSAAPPPPLPLESNNRLLSSHELTLMRQMTECPHKGVTFIDVEMTNILSDSEHQHYDANVAKLRGLLDAEKNFRLASWLIVSVLRGDANTQWTCLVVDVRPRPRYSSPAFLLECLHVPQPAFLPKSPLPITTLRRADALIQALDSVGGQFFTIDSVQPFQQAFQAPQHLAHASGDSKAIRSDRSDWMSGYFAHCYAMVVASATSKKLPVTECLAQVTSTVVTRVRDVLQQAAKAIDSNDCDAYHSLRWPVELSCEQLFLGSTAGRASLLPRSPLPGCLHCAKSASSDAGSLLAQMNDSAWKAALSACRSCRDKYAVKQPTRVDIGPLKSWPPTSLWTVTAGLFANFVKWPGNVVFLRAGDVDAIVQYALDREKTYDRKCRMFWGCET